MADHVHPTAFGQVAIAERALDVLAADGMAVRVRPVGADRALDEPTRWQRLRGDATYAYRHAKVSARAARDCGALPLTACQDGTTGESASP